MVRLHKQTNGALGIWKYKWIFTIVGAALLDDCWGVFPVGVDIPLFLFSIFFCGVLILFNTQNYGLLEF